MIARRSMGGNAWGRLSLQQQLPGSPIDQMDFPACRTEMRLVPAHIVDNRLDRRFHMAAGIGASIDDRGFHNETLCRYLCRSTLRQIKKKMHGSRDSLTTDNGRGFFPEYFDQRSHTLVEGR
ncbi:hypothetical protein [Enhydrobacter aerosaccus]|uniref:hypothetical protein n=1 Tax=Enhydrobacter aerosaccus TaxID=225324 RepID=UPI0014820BE3|nr:hypothetical protein [Enhydrobacter aerosaccus]